MDFLTTIAIIFSCVAANHLGLVAAVEDIIRRDIPVVRCPKCFSFWSTLAYGMATAYCRHDGADVISVVAVAFLSSWAAVWLDMFMGVIDRLYLYVYGKIYTTADTGNADALPARDTMPGVSAEKSCRQERE